MAAEQRDELHKIQPNTRVKSDTTLSHIHTSYYNFEGILVL